MLTEQTSGTETMSLAIDTLPLGLFIADDGRTLLVTDHDEWTTVPVTLVQQLNGLMPLPVKLSNGSEANTSFIQLNFDRPVTSANNSAPTLVLNPSQSALSFGNNLSGPRTTKTTLVQDQLANSATDKIILENSDTNQEPSAPVLPAISKRSPGRPRKDAIRPPGAEKKCDVCGETFQNAVQLRKHMESHADEKPHRCPKCPESFNIPINFTLHMATHNTGDPKCPVCGRKFARKASLKSHLLLHEKEEHLFCKECEDAFPTKTQLETHLRLHDEKWLTDDVRKCKLCNEQFTQPALYRIHIREHYKLRTKILKQTKKGIIHKTVYKCKICLKIFQKPSQLLRHIRVHTGEKPFTCNICNRSFSQKSSLQIHSWKHAAVRPYNCSHCNAKFNQKGNLNSHIQRVHYPPDVGPIYSCPQCSCFFKKMHGLSTHMKKMHSNRAEEATCDSSTEIGKNENNSTRPNPNTSNDVDSTATESQPNDILQQALNKSGLAEKAVRQVVETKEATKNNETNLVTILDKTPDGSLRKYITFKQRCVGATKWYACPYCHKEFKKPSDLIRHIRVHTQEKPFKCSQCYRSFALKSTLKCHERIHGGQKSYTCGVCGQKFACSSSLKTHIRTHQSLSQCHICDKTFASANILKSHVKTHGKPSRSKISADAEALIPQIVLEEPLLISDAGNKISIAQVQSKQNHVKNNKEDGVRPHKCWACPAAFRKISHLKQHYRRHTGERPYKCPTCDRKFTSNSVLKSHLQTHESDRPWHCNMCSATFSTQSSMKRHLVTHSNKRPFMCPYCHKTFKTTVNCRKHMKIHKTELAQQQLDKQNAETVSLSADKTDMLPTLPVNLNLSDDITDNFPQTMTTDFTQAFSEQFPSISNVKEINLVENSAETKIVNLSEADNMRTSQTLHADETGTITISNYSGDQILTPESIREIEETLNQQLFHLGMNLGLGNNLPRSMGDSDVGNLESREPTVLNIIYENSKELESTDGATINSNMFSTNFDTFDMSQIALQSDSEIDIGINSVNSTSMASILPRSAQEEQRLIPVTVENNLEDNQAKEAKHVVVVSSLPTYTELTKPVQSFLKYPKIIAKADTTDETDRLNLNGESNDQLTTITEQSVQFTDTYCDKNFTEEHELNNHYVAHLSLNANKTIENRETTSNEMINKENTLQCHMCFKKEYNVDSLKAHLKTHCGPKEFQCPECHMKFCTNGGLSRHVKMHFIKQLNTWNCSQCSKAFSSEDQYNAHMKIHNPVDWALPIEPDSSQKEDPTLSQSNLSNSMTVKPPQQHPDLVTTAESLSEPSKHSEAAPEKKKYGNQCQFCPKTFRKPSDLVRHIRTHTGERPYQCEHCDKSFAVKCTLDCHLKVHMGNEKFCCNVCNRLFATKGSLKVHMRLHTGVKPFTCHLCNLQFRTSGHRKVHLATHNRENKRADGRGRVKKILPSEEVSTEETDKTMKNDVSIENVPSQFTNLETITIDTSGISDQLTFNTDGTIINNNSVLSVNESNQLVANLQFLLANGLVTLQTDESLLAPLNTVDNTPVAQDHVSENTLVAPQDTINQVACNPTDNLMPAQLNVQENVNQAHLPLENCLEIPSNPPASECAVLPTRQPVKTARSATKTQLKECDICGKTFLKVSQLERHRRTHTGERPFKCSVCPKSFAQKATLQIHQNLHTGDRPFACPHCDYTFTQKWNLQTHLKRVHPFDAAGGKKLRKGQQIVSAKVIQDDNLSQNRIPNFDDISLVELLK